MRSVFVGLIAVAGPAGGACTPDWAKQDEAQVFLRIIDVQGVPGSDDQDAGDMLFSDVCCAIFNDNATLTFQAIPKNQNLGILPTLVEDVFLERYEVLFFRSDGRNTEGVDVPYRITGSVSQRIPADTSENEVSIVVVRHQAKIEPPLRNLHGVFLQGLPPSGVFQFGGAGILTTIAEITVHGRTTSNHAVQAQTRLQVTFADFGGEG